MRAHLFAVCAQVSNELPGRSILLVAEALQTLDLLLSLFDLFIAQRNLLLECLDLVVVLRLIFLFFSHSLYIYISTHTHT